MQPHRRNCTTQQGCFQTASKSSNGAKSMDRGSGLKASHVCQQMQHCCEKLHNLTSVTALPSKAAFRPPHRVTLVQRARTGFQAQVLCMSVSKCSTHQTPSGLRSHALSRWHMCCTCCMPQGSILLETSITRNHLGSVAMSCPGCTSS